MIRHIKKLLLALACSLFLLGTTMVAQEKTITSIIPLTIVDKAGLPIQGVTVSGTFGVLTTDYLGKCYIKSDGKGTVSIEKSGYISNNILVSELKEKMTLEKAIFLASDGDVINMGFIKQKKRDIITSVSSLKPDERITFDNTESALGHIDGVLTGLRAGGDIRGLSNAMYVIDGIPGRDISLLDASEIEQITVLKDVNALIQYGSEGKNGVIVVTTKRGIKNKNSIKVNGSYGLKAPISYPDYLNAADYMTLYNEAYKNDGLTGVKFDSTTIANTKSGLNPYKYPDINLYSSDYLKSFTEQMNVMTEFSGGNNNLQYYVNLDFKSNGTLEKLNPEVSKPSRTFKLRGNLDFAINNWIKATVDVMTSINTQKSAYNKVLSTGTSFLPNLYSPLLPLSMMSSDPVLQQQLSTVNTYNGFVLGGSQSYLTNIPFANIFAKGYINTINMNSQVANTVSFDLSKITKGLSANTKISLDYVDQHNLSITNKFNFYAPTWKNYPAHYVYKYDDANIKIDSTMIASSDSINALTALGTADQKDQTEGVAINDFALRTGFYAQINYERQLNENHYIKAMLLGYADSYKRMNSRQTDVESHIALSLDYNFKNKLYVNISTNYASSKYLALGHQGAFSPSAGISYILSEESFLKDNPVINYLKIRATAGILKTDLNFSKYFMYQDLYDNLGSGGYSWADGLYSGKYTVQQNGQNLNLGFETRKDVSFGFESQLFNSFWLETSFFRTAMADIVMQPGSIFPSFFDTSNSTSPNSFVPYQNFGENSYQGVEAGVNYKKTLGNFRFDIGANFVYTVSKIVKTDQVPQLYPYLSAIGQSTGRIVGLVADGFYQATDFNPNGTLKADLNTEGKLMYPIPQFGKVYPGNIKYVDLNDDGVIDANDKKTIGNNSFPYTLGLNCMVGYKRFSLFVLGKMQSGAQTMRNGYYWVNGQDKYNTTVLGRWTPETAATATYPRLTTTAGANDFQNSSFWLYDKSYFDIRRVQLTYEISDRLCHKIGFNKINLDLGAENLIKIAPNKDILELNIGGNPEFRIYTLGLRMSL